MYLKAIGRTPLLSDAEEIDLAMRMDEGASARGLLASFEASGTIDPGRFRGIVWGVVSVRDLQLDPANGLRLEGMGREVVSRTYRPRNRVKAVAFLRRVERDASDAQSHLIEGNLRLVVSIAKRYVGRGMLFLDLVQEGNLGLIRATEMFDHSMGNKFSTYASWWIRRGISRAIADQARTIRAPAHVAGLIGMIRRAQSQLVQALGREPLPEESVPDRTAVAPVNAAVAAMLRRNVESALGTLTSRERRVIELRIGIVDDRPRTLEDVAVEFDLTRERIRQIEAKALSKLRHPSNALMLHDYVG